MCRFYPKPKPLSHLHTVPCLVTITSFAQEIFGYGSKLVKVAYEYQQHVWDLIDMFQLNSNIANGRNPGTLVPWSPSLSNV